MSNKVAAGKAVTPSNGRIGKRAKPKPKYQSKKDKSVKWTGRGMTPTWMREEMRGTKRTTRLVAPRTTIRTKLHWSAGANVRTGIAYGPAFGIDGSTVMVERPDGTRVREHLDVGENPPNGAIVYYWLAEDAKEAVTLTFRDSSGRKIVSYASDTKDAPPVRCATRHCRSGH